MLRVLPPRKKTPCNLTAVKRATSQQCTVAKTGRLFFCAVARGVGVCVPHINSPAKDKVQYITLYNVPFWLMESSGNPLLLESHMFLPLHVQNPGIPYTAVPYCFASQTKRRTHIPILSK